MADLPDGILNGRSQRVIELAQREAELMGQQFVGPEHLLLGIIKEGDNIGRQALAQFAELDLLEIRGRILELTKKAKPPGNSWRDQLLGTKAATQDAIPQPDPLAELKTMLPALKRMGSLLLEDIAGHLRK